MNDHEVRTGERLSYKDVADRTGLAISTVQSLGARGTYNARLSTIAAICDALQCTPNELLEYRPVGEVSD